MPALCPPHISRFTSQAAAEMQRRWRDGSLEEDLPMRGLSEMFNVNYFLVGGVGRPRAEGRGPEMAAWIGLESGCCEGACFTAMHAAGSD